MTQSPGFALDIFVGGDEARAETTFRLTGEFDRLQAERFDRAAAGVGAQEPSVCVDLRSTTIIDSAALGSLVRLRRMLHERDASLTVLVSRPFQVTVMRVSGLFEYLGVAVLDEPGDD